MTKNRKRGKVVTAKFHTIIYGGQALGNVVSQDPDDGKKILAWGVLPGEAATITITKNKPTFYEGIVETVLEPASQRINPKDASSYLSTSPWQIMSFQAELFYKSALIEEAFELQNIVLPYPITNWTNHEEYYYRNKIEYSFWYDKDKEKLNLAFFKRGSHFKMPISKTSLAMPAITNLANDMLDILNKHQVSGRHLKTLLVRATQKGDTAWQLYIKDQSSLTQPLKESLDVLGNGEVIYSNPNSPASVKTDSLFKTKRNTTLGDTILGQDFYYQTDGFFQINIPVYEKVLEDIKKYIPSNMPVLDLYSGVGTIGLSVAPKNQLTLVEVNPVAFNEMKENIQLLNLSKIAKPVLAASEDATNYIKTNQITIVDPPRAGLHKEVVNTLIKKQPFRIIYLSCNPVTQARDIAPLLDYYRITYHKGYNFFPRTPHIEHLVVLDKIKK